jgi:hypothetical protein
VSFSGVGGTARCCGVRGATRPGIHGSRDSDRGGSLGTPVEGAVSGSIDFPSLNTSQAQATEAGENTGTA